MEILLKKYTLSQFSNDFYHRFYLHLFFLSQTKNFNERENNEKTNDFLMKRVSDNIFDCLKIFPKLIYHLICL